MDNPFKNILTNEKVPEILREKVVNDLAFVKLSLDTADLFAVKYPSVIKEFLDVEEHQEEKKENKPKKK